LEQETAKNCAAGVKPEDARYAALRSFGGVDQVKEQCRATRGSRLVEEFFQDVRYGLRTLRKSPGFAAVAVFTIALGIGANTAVFSVVNAVLLRPLPYREPDRLLMIWKMKFGDGGLGSPASDFLNWREQNQVFEGLGAFAMQSFNLAGGGVPEQVEGMRATPGFFTTLGVAARRGRTFLPQEEALGADRVALVSHGLWRKYQETDRDLLGSTLRLNGAPYLVVGVMPEGFEDFRGYKADVWVPLPLSPTGGERNQIVARLKDGVTLQQAQANMDVIAARLRQSSNAGKEGETPILVPLYTEVVGSAREVLLPLLGAVGLVLLVACSTVANLLLARAAGRNREMALRAALGASRVRLVRQLLTESVLLALVGCAFGLLIARWGLSLLIAAGPKNIPRLHEIGTDLQVLSFALGVSVITGLLFGLAPALRASKVDLNESLKAGGKVSGTGLGRQLLRNGLVTAEIALALVLLIGAGLLIDSFVRLIRVETGFEPKNVLTMKITLPTYSYRGGYEINGFFRRAVEQVRTLPNVQAAALVNYLPLGRGVTYGSLTLQEACPRLLLRTLKAGKVGPSALGTGSAQVTSRRWVLVC
jgi:predicted permease